MAVLALVLAAASPAAAAVPTTGITVVPAGAGGELVKFTYLRCSVGTSRTPSLGPRVFRATSTSRGWTLGVTIYRFAGYKTYPIHRKGAGNVLFTIDPPGVGGNYGPAAGPDLPLPPVGGAVSFGPGGSRMGMGFVNAWFSSDVNRAVTVAGGAACHFPVPRRR